MRSSHVPALAAAVELGGAQVRDIRAWLRTLTGELPAAYIAEPPLPAPGP